MKIRIQKHIISILILISLFLACPSQLYASKVSTDDVTNIENEQKVEEAKLKIAKAKKELEELNRTTPKTSPAIGSIDAGKNEAIFTHIIAYRCSREIAKNLVILNPKIITM